MLLNASIDVDAISDFDFAAEMQVRSVPAIFFAVNGKYLKDNKFFKYLTLY